MSFIKTYCNIIEQLIRLKFPEIEGLEVIIKDNNNFEIIFKQGKYSKEEVESEIKSDIEKAKNFNFDINELLCLD